MTRPRQARTNRTDYRILLVSALALALAIYLFPRVSTSVSLLLPSLFPASLLPSALFPHSAPFTPTALSALSTPTTAATTTAAMAASSSKSDTPNGRTPRTAKDFSVGEFRKWNKLADGMERFHEKFAWEFNNVYDVSALAPVCADPQMADGGWKKAKLSFPRFLREAEQVSHHLDLHHRIEEAYIFPMLAKKLPQFRMNGKGGKDHVEMHRKIHNGESLPWRDCWCDAGGSGEGLTAGLKRYDEYLDKAQRDPDAYDGAELRKIMDSFRDVLFNHLDLEVKDLGAESVYNAGFTLDELARFPL